MNTLMKRTKRNIASAFIGMLFTLPTQLASYESGFDIEEIEQSADCLAVLQKSCIESPSLWKETHCKKTADAIVTVLSQQGIIKEETIARSDFHNFEKTTMGKKLLGNAQQDERRLFHINVCGSGHVFVVELEEIVEDEEERCCKIVQSWEEEFTLPEWLALERWENKEFNHDFVEFGQGKGISQGQLVGFIAQQIETCAGRMREFRSLRVGIPYELEVTSFIINKQKKSVIKS